MIIDGYCEMMILVVGGKLDLFIHMMWIGTMYNILVT